MDFIWRGLIEKEKRWVFFDIDDCVVCIKKNRFTSILGFKEFVNGSTITRGSIILRVFEGNKVYDKETDRYIGVCIYLNGFKVVTNDNQYKVYDVNSMYVKDRNSFVNINIFDRTPLEFKANEITFTFEDFAYVHKGITYLKIGKRRVKIRSKDVRPCIYKDDNMNVYAGDLYQGHVMSVVNINNLEK